VSKPGDLVVVQFRLARSRSCARSACRTAGDLDRFAPDIGVLVPRGHEVIVKWRDEAAGHHARYARAAGRGDRTTPDGELNGELGRHRARPGEVPPPPKLTESRSSPKNELLNAAGLTGIRIPGHSVRRQPRSSPTVCSSS